MHEQGGSTSSGPLMSVKDTKRMAELLLTPEEELEGLLAADWFSPSSPTPCSGTAGARCWRSVTTTR